MPPFPYLEKTVESMAQAAFDHPVHPLSLR